MCESIQGCNNTTRIRQYTISLVERLVVGSGILLFIGIIAYIFLFVLMCVI